MNLRGAARAEASEKFCREWGSQREGRDLNLREWPEALTWPHENLGWGSLGLRPGGGVSDARSRQTRAWVPGGNVGGLTVGRGRRWAWSSLRRRSHPGGLKGLNSETGSRESGRCPNAWRGQGRGGGLRGCGQLSSDRLTQVGVIRTLRGVGAKPMIGGVMVQRAWSDPGGRTRVKT